eukprot:15274711-Alexandrium_andersonii.AAC.1
MPFKHGAVGGVVSRTVLETPVVKRSCSWSCHHCVLLRHEAQFLNAVEQRGVPPLNTVPLESLPPWYSGRARMEAFHALCFNPDESKTDWLLALERRLLERNEAWGSCIQFAPRRLAVLTDTLRKIEDGQ